MNDICTFHDLVLLHGQSWCKTNDVSMRGLQQEHMSSLHRLCADLSLLIMHQKQSKMMTIQRQADTVVPAISIFEAMLHDTLHADHDDKSQGSGQLHTRYHY